MRRAQDLTDAMVSTIKGMLRRGDRQFDIAVWWDTPLVYVSNIATGKRGRGIPAAPLETLPPAGPYQIVSVDAHARLQEAAAVPLKTLQEVVTRLASIQRQLENLERRHDNHGTVQVVDGRGSGVSVSA